uniref:Transmembrane protein n=1 Tax=Leersia perrieri TaxID=77586 RepID=A0A0D9XB78_9ORYZ
MGQQNSNPSFYNFLKEGFLLPSRNKNLFTAVFALVAVSTSLLVVSSDLAVQPLVEEIRLDANALNSTDPNSPEFTKLINEIQDDTRKLMIAVAVYLLFAVVIASAIRIILLFAAVATYSGERHSFGELLGKARSQLKGPVLTLAFVFVLEIAYVALLAAMAGLIGFLIVHKHYVTVLVLSMLVLVGAIFFVYFSVVCNFSVVVSVAELGCHGAGALGRAWRMVKSKKRRLVLYVAAVSVLAALVSLLHNLTMTIWARGSVVAGLLLVLVYAVLMAAVDLFGVCAITAFYYECKEAVVTDQYVRVSTDEQPKA